MPLDTLKSIRERRTIKALSNTPLPSTPVDKLFVETLIESAYWAPFHYPTHSEHKRGKLTSDLPFRFYVLDSACCRDVAKRLDSANVKSGKLLGMLNTADYLIQATWTPQPCAYEQLFAPSLANMEHIAAAGAAIQNLLLTATALGRENYWGSGGVLRDEFAFEWLDIPINQILLGSLFIFPNEKGASDEVEFEPGSKRNLRGEITDCYRFVKL